MKGIPIIAGAALGAMALAGASAAEPAPATCFLEVSRLLADPPTGVGDLGAAIRQLDAALRPQVEAINKLRSELLALQQRQQRALEGEESEADLVALQEEAQRLGAELDARQAQLKLDYAARHKALVGPVQTRVGERAQAFAAERGCAEIRMARQPDLGALRAAAAQDVTGEFVAWYALNKAS